MTLCAPCPSLAFRVFQELIVHENEQVVSIGESITQASHDQNVVVEALEDLISE